MSNLSNDFLKSVIDGNFSEWVKVKKFSLSPNRFDETIDVFDFKALERHHEEETRFLIGLCRKLAGEVLKLRNED